MPNAMIKVREILASSKPRTLTEIRIATGLDKSEVSMALSYLVKSNRASRRQIANPGPGARYVWEYTILE
jgi:DNA-binding transcriptional regulator GbsR (MarR family)